LLCGREADVFAKALDAHDWMIVPQPHCSDQDVRWVMNEPSADCPSWADNGPDPMPPRPRLTVIDGGKKNDD
jgi:hypothetical protein